MGGSLQSSELILVEQFLMCATAQVFAGSRISARWRSLVRDDAAWGGDIVPNTARRNGVSAFETPQPHIPPNCHPVAKRDLPPDGFPDSRSGSSPHALPHGNGIDSKQISRKVKTVPTARSPSLTPPGSPAAALHRRALPRLHAQGRCRGVPVPRRGNG